MGHYFLDFSEENKTFPMIENVCREIEQKCVKSETVVETKLTIWNILTPFRVLRHKTSQDVTKRRKTFSIRNQKLFSGEKLASVSVDATFCDEAYGTGSGVAKP